jgi:adenine-specific DNA-methyltransferase
LKIQKLNSGVGIYSGLYILTYKEFDEIKKALINPFFINFIESLRKYKNGGCYTFNTSDVQKYLNYYFDNIDI